MSLYDSRTYVMAIDTVTIGTVVQDIFALKSGASNGISIHQIHLDSTNAVAAPLRMRLKRGTATVTLGSGGSTPTISPVDVNDTATGSTAHANDTTQATTTGAFTALHYFQWDTVLPFDFLPAPEDRPKCTVSQGMILDLPAAIASTVISGYIIWAEVP